MRTKGVAFLLLLAGAELLAQPAAPRTWEFDARTEIRLHLRDSNDDFFPLAFPFDPVMIPPGATEGREQTVDPGLNAEAGLVSLQLDVRYGSLFAARAKVDAVDLYERNPTSEDRKIDADELWIRFGPKPERLDLPSGTSFFFQAGKAPKMERQPVRLLESYGLASTAFSRVEDVQLLTGGSVGRNVYWRAQVSNGNPVFFRDPNALAGDNGTSELLRPFPDPRLKSGFPILYDAEVEDYFLDFEHEEIGGALGYRWRTASGTGVDILLFHYERELAERVELDGTFYGGDLDLLDGTRGFSLPIEGNDKSESGARLYGEAGGATLVAQYVEQTIAGLDRNGTEVELGYRFDLTTGPALGGRLLFESIQPAVRWSYLDNHFRGPREYPAPSVWWDWTKLDVGLRIAMLEHYDITVEHAFHDVDIARELDVDETLVTFRVRF